MKSENHLAYWDHALSSKVTRKGVLCHWHEFPDGYVARSHSHVGIEVIYPESGVGALHIGDAHHHITPGVIFLFPASVPHRPVVAYNYRRWNLCILPDLIESKIAIPSTVVISYLNTRAQRKIKEIFQDIMSELEEQHRDAERYIRLLIKQFIMWLQRGESRRSTRLSSSPHPDQIETMNKLMNYIESNLQSDLSIDVLAKAVNYSASHIWRLIHASTNQSPMEYINNRRLDRAKRLLSQSEYPIAVVADMVGFRSPTYFSQKFKEKTGLTPREFRQRSTPSF